MLVVGDGSKIQGLKNTAAIIPPKAASSRPQRGGGVTPFLYRYIYLGEYIYTRYIFIYNIYIYYVI